MMMTECTGSYGPASSLLIEVGELMFELNLTGDD